MNKLYIYNTNKQIH